MKNLTTSLKKLKIIFLFLTFATFAKATDFDGFVLTCPNGPCYAVANTYVQLYYINGAQAATPAVTNALGYYQFYNVFPGTYVMIVNGVNQTIQVYGSYERFPNFYI